MTSTIIFAVAAIIVLVGGLVELRDALSDRTAHFTATQAEKRLRSVLDPTAILVWSLVTAAFLLIPATLRDRSLGFTEAGALILAVGMACERVSYLITKSATVRSSRGSLLAAITVLAAGSGLVVGLTG